MLLIWLFFSSILTLIIYMMLGLPFALWFYSISSWWDYTGRTSFHFEAYIVIWIVFAIVFACIIHFRNSPYKIASLKLYETKKTSFFRDFGNVFLNQRQNTLAIILTTAIYYIIHILLLLVNASNPIQSIIGFAMFPFTGILLLKMQAFSIDLLPQILGIFFINVFVIVFVYLLSVVIMRRIWYRKHLNMKKTKET